MKYYKLKIFCDFDGTITINDVWVNSLGKFIKNKSKFQELCNLFDRNIISARECIKKELELIEDFSFEKFNKYLDEEKIDPYFKNFIDYCHQNEYEIFIISEGLDYYIERILKRENINLPYYCNKMITYYDNDSKLKLSCEFPYSDENCVFCGMSKRNIILSHTNEYDNEISVLIGDGTSDFCAANYADIVFAKKKLVSYCWKNNITYFPFNNFLDIMNKLNKLKEKNKIKMRQTAQMLRRDVYMGG